MGSPLRENFLELVRQIFILRFKVIDDPVLVFNVPLQLLDLMLETTDLILMDIFEFLNLSLSSSFHAFSLRLDQGVILDLLGLPSGQTFLGLSSQISLSLFKMSNLIVAGSDLTLL